MQCTMQENLLKTPSSIFSNRGYCVVLIWLKEIARVERTFFWRIISFACTWWELSLFVLALKNIKMFLIARKGHFPNEILKLVLGYDSACGRIMTKPIWYSLRAVVDDIRIKYMKIEMMFKEACFISHIFEKTFLILNGTWRVFESVKEYFPSQTLNNVYPVHYVVPSFDTAEKWHACVVWCKKHY